MLTWSILFSGAFVTDSRRWFIVECRVVVGVHRSEPQGVSLRGSEQHHERSATTEVRLSPVRWATQLRQAAVCATFRDRVTLSLSESSVAMGGPRDAHHRLVLQSECRALRRSQQFSVYQSDTFRMSNMAVTRGLHRQVLE